MSVFKIPRSHAKGTRWVAQVWIEGKIHRAYFDPETGKEIASKARAKELEHQLLQEKGRIVSRGGANHLVSESRDSGPNSFCLHLGRSLTMLIALFSEDRGVMN